MRCWIVALFVLLIARPALALEPILDRLVVLTFDDSVKSHFTVVRPILLDYEFGATFFITEGFDFKTNKDEYMTWEQIAQLHQDGFEIGNHTRDHQGISEQNDSEVEEQLEAINQQCEAHGIPRTTSFAYPGNQFHPDGFAELSRLGITFARRGGAPEFEYKEGKGFAYEPGKDHPLLLPSAGDARPNWTMADFLRAVSQAKDGRIAILQFHGVPDNEHPWVHTPEDQFRAFMKYLSLNDYKVIALRDLSRYVDPTKTPESHETIIEQRKQSLKE
ncbi:MAG: polysaccharide deacetylase family protein [Planctomycetaceae bacterium]|nr:polysaccharide deacetylase family protein [Planctomycetaceae bacterium]